MNRFLINDIWVVNEIISIWTHFICSTSNWNFFIQFIWADVVFSPTSPCYENNWSVSDIKKSTFARQTFVNSRICSSISRQRLRCAFNKHSTEKWLSIPTPRAGDDCSLIPTSSTGNTGIFLEIKEFKKRQNIKGNFPWDLIHKSLKIIQWFG